MYYSGPLRQRGGGIGDVFRVFTRTVIPYVYKNWGKKIKNTAARMAPKALEKALSFGVGVASDIAQKKSLKQSIKDRGKRILSDVLNSAAPPAKRQKQASARVGNKRRKGRPTKKGDIFG